MPDLRKFFITHSWKDIDFAHKLCDDLKANGLDGFLDAHSMRPGDSIPSRIERGLQECDVYIPVLSPDSLSSDWCEWEIDLAITMNRTRKGRPRIIPVIARPCPVPDRLINLLHVNFVGRYEGALKELLIGGFDLPVAPPKPEATIPPTPVNQTGPSENGTEALSEIEKEYRQAIRALLLGQWEQAVMSFRRVIAADPNYRDAPLRLRDAEKFLAQARVQPASAGTHVQPRPKAQPSLSSILAVVIAAFGIMALSWVALNTVIALTTSSPTLAPTQITTPPYPTLTPVPAASPIAAASNTASAKIISPLNAGQVKQLALWQNTVNIRQLAWSPHGRQLAIASYGIFLYDAQTFTQTRAIETGGWISSIAFSPDGLTLAAASLDGAELWSVPGGAKLHTFDLKDAHSVAFSPNGTIAVSVGGAVKLLDAASKTESNTLVGHKSSVTPVAFSPDGRILASGSLGEVKLWEMPGGRELHTLTHPNWNWVQSIAFSPDGRKLATGSVDNRVELWDVTTGQMLSSFIGHTGQIESVAFSPDGQLLASASWDLTVKLWDTASGREVRTLTGHTAWVQSVAFSPDGQLLASGASDGTMLLWGIAP